MVVLSKFAHIFLRDNKCLLFENMAYINIHFVFIMIILFTGLTSAGVHGSSKVKDEDKAYYIAQVLVDNLNLTKQLWKIGEVFHAFSQIVKSNANDSEFHKLDQDAKNDVYNYLLDGIPRLFSDDVFSNISLDVLDELDTALGRINFSRNISVYTNNDGSLSDDALLNLLKELNWKHLVKRVLEDSKPFIDKLGGKDSTVIISTANYIFDIVSDIWEDPEFKAARVAVVDELTAGYKHFVDDQLCKGSDVIRDKSSIIGKGILKNTSQTRLLEKLVHTEKLLFDKLMGHNSTLMLIFS